MLKATFHDKSMININKNSAKSGYFECFSWIKCFLVDIKYIMAVLFKKVSVFIIQEQKLKRLENKKWFLLDITPIKRVFGTKKPH